MAVPTQHSQGIIRNIRLDNIVSDTMNERFGPQQDIAGFQALQMRSIGQGVPGANGLFSSPGRGNGSGLSDYTRIAEMQALIEGMARSNQVIMNIGNQALTAHELIKSRQQDSHSQRSGSKVSFKIDQDPELGNIEGKLARLDQNTNRYVGKLSKA